MTSRDDYVLGTHDDEVARLGLQHLVWRPRALDAWRRAGFTVGQTLIDVGCGPGYATLDLADIVGPRGRIVAIDKSRRFLDVLEERASRRGLARIEAHALDLDDAALPPVAADGAWARWVFAFVRNPRALLGRVAECLRPGGTFVFHEYIDYRVWRTAPRCESIEEFVAAVMASWRASGGEPDIGLELPGWLGELGFTLASIRPIVDVVSPANFVWQWPKAFLQVNLDRQVALGTLSAARAAEIARDLERLEAEPHTLMITPLVIEIIAVKP